MTTEASLKVKNRWYVFAFVVANAVVGVLAASPTLWSGVLALAKVEVGVLAGCAFAGASLVMAMNGIATYRLKIRLLFLDHSPPDPSFRVFQLCRTDARVDLRKLQEMIGTLPTKPREQNDIWQGWYRNYESEPAVRAGNGQFLLFRDLAWVGLVLGIAGGGTALVVSKGSSSAFAYSLGTLALALLFGVVARVQAERFVCTVVAHACRGESEKSK